MGFYQAKKGDGEEGEEDRSNYSNEIEEDFQIKFASDLIRNSQSAKRKAMLENAKGLLGPTTAAEDKKIQDALAGIGIDWSKQDSGGKPEAQVTFNILSSAGQVLKAGEEVKLELKVHNVGEGAFNQLIASTESENFMLKNREFIFGKILPGETRSWVVPIKIPAAALRREDKVTFSFREGNGKVPENFQTVITTEPLPRPTFAYKYEVSEEGRGADKQKIEAGAQSSIKVQVKNEGPGLSKKTVLNLKNLDGEGIFIGKGREKLDQLPAGAEKGGLLNFSVGKAYSKDKVELELSVSDQETMESLGDKLKFSVGQAVPGLSSFETAPRIVLNPESQPSHTGSKKIKVSGKVEDASGLKDVSVYVGDYKAYLQVFPQGEGNAAVTTGNFEAELPLKEKDNNLITIMARDKNDLSTRQSFYIRQE